MYKKIMFLIITLSIIINVGNSTVVMAKENIVTEIVDFPVTINYEEYNVDDVLHRVALLILLILPLANKGFLWYALSTERVSPMKS